MGQVTPLATADFHLMQSECICIVLDSIPGRLMVRIPWDQDIPELLLTSRADRWYFWEVRKDSQGREIFGYHQCVEGDRVKTILTISPRLFKEFPAIWPAGKSKVEFGYWEYPNELYSPLEALGT